ncbi:T9SS type A sorting domain-containing protein [Flavitalea flava]
MKLFILLAVVLSATLSIRAQIPQKFNYQAIVRGNAGTVIANKPLGLRFSIRDGSATGTVQYSETQLTTSNAYGLVNLQVGAGTVASGTFPAITWSTGNKFLQVEIDTTGSANYISLATVELITVPYAVQAVHALVADSTASFSGTLAGDVAGLQKATHLQDGVVTPAKIASGAVAATHIAAGQVVKSINGLTDNMVLVGAGGTNLSITGNAITITGAPGTITGVTPGNGLTGGGSTGNVSLTANYGGDGSSNTLSRSDHDHVGQYWTSNNASPALGLINSTDAPALYVQSAATGFNSAAMSVYVLNTNSQSPCIYAQNNSTNANSVGVLGQANGAGTGKGVWGVGFGAGTYGIMGSALGANSWAGVFSGNVYVGGTLSKAAGSFKIDHPLDPANKTLSHSFVESPDMYPNPVHDKLFIHGYSDQAEDLDLRLMDIQGRVLLVSRISFLQGYNDATLSLSKLARGIYILSITDHVHGGKEALKLLKE